MVKELDLTPYHNSVRKKAALIFLLSAAGIFVSIYSICVTQMNIGFGEAIDYIIGHFQGTVYDDYYMQLKSEIVWESLVPMAVVGLLVGGILGVSGAVMQIIIKNPVADPYTIGISSGALFGVTLFIVLDFSVTGFMSEIGQVLNAFVFSLIPVAIIILFSTVKKVTPTVMVLIGIAVMYIFSAFTTLLKYTATEDDIASIYAWSVGSLGSVGWESVPFTLFGFVLILLTMVLVSNKLNVLSVGDNACRALGEDPNRLRLVCLVLISIATSTAVCYTGTIGFIGLIAPHICRMFVGSNAKYLVPCSAAMGALTLMASETLARCIGSTGVSVGIITALVGGPIFLFFLIRQKRSAW